MHFERGDLIAFNYEIESFSPEENIELGVYDYTGFIKAFKPVICLAIDETFIFKRLRLFILNDARLVCVTVRERDVALVGKFTTCYSAVG